MHTRILTVSAVSATAAAATLLGIAVAPEMGKLADVGRNRKARKEWEASRAERERHEQERSHLVMTGPAATIHRCSVCVLDHSPVCAAYSEHPTPRGGLS